MNGRPLILLIIGLIFSSIIRLRFSLHDGIEFGGFWITAPITFLSFSNRFNPLLTTTFVGYLIYLLMGIIEYKAAAKQTERRQILTLFCIFCVAVAGYEVSQIISDSKGTYNGRHFHCGPLIFIAGLWLLVKKDKIDS